VAAAARADNFLANNPPEVIWNGFQADAHVLQPGSEAEAVLAEVHAATLGEAMPARLSTAVNDTRFYDLYYGVKALCYGPGGEGSHGFDERADLAALKRTTLVIAGFIAEWCGTHEIATA
jgi:acetylornithine deacetylase